MLTLLTIIDLSLAALGSPVCVEAQPQVPELNWSTTEVATLARTLIEP